MEAINFITPQATNIGSNVFDFSKSFLGLNNDTKLHFKTTIVPKLVSDTQTASQSSYWAAFSAPYHLSNSADANLLIPKEVILAALEKHPENIHTLVHYLVGRLITRMEENEAEENEEKPETPKEEGFGFGKALGFGWNAVREIATGNSGASPVVGGEKEEKEGNKEIMACVRCLSRVIPIIYEFDATKVRDRRHRRDRSEKSGHEEEDEEGTIEEEIFWTLRPVKQSDGGSIVSFGVGSSGSKKYDRPVVDEEVTLQTPTPEQSQFIIDDDDSEPDSPIVPTPTVSHPNPPPIHVQTSSPLPPAAALGDEDQYLPPLGTVIPPVLVDLLFHPSLTVTSTRGSYPIWEPGLGSSTSPSASSNTEKIMQYRTEILNLLLICLSKTLYTSLLPTTHEPDEPNLWIDALFRGLRKKPTLSTLCSLINTSIRVLGIGAGGGTSSAQSPPLTPSGRGGAGNIRKHERKGSGVLQLVGGIADRVRGSTDRRQELGRTCLLVLGVLLTEMGLEGAEELLGLPDQMAGPFGEKGGWSRSSVNLSRLSLDSARPSEFGGDGGVVTSPTTVGGGNGMVAQNPYLFYLSKLHRAKDFNHILSGAFSILHNIINILHTPSLISSTLTQHQISQHNIVKGETLLMLWRFTQSNKRFESFMFESANSSVELAVYLLFFALEAKDDPAQFGLVRLTLFFLHTLSAERAFGSRLNTRLNELKLVNGMHIKGKWAGSVGGGTVADFMIVSIYHLIFSTKSKLSTLYPTMTIILSNTSPFWKNLSATASTRLMQIFLAFSNPAFILQEEGNPRLVFYILEAFNNVIHYTINDNPHVLYSMLRSHRRFEDLGNFTLARAASDIHKQRAEMKLGHRRRQTLANLDSVFDKSPSPVGTLTPSDTPGTPIAVESALPAVKSPLDEKFDSAVEETMTMNFGMTVTEEPISEKKRGKMREVIVEEEEGDEKDEDGKVITNNGRRETATRWEGKNGFVATEEWVASWREGLPLDGILIMISELYPKVASLSTVQSPASTQAVLDFLRNASLSEVLPQSHPVRSRPFVSTVQSSSWSTSLVWGWSYVSIEYFRNTTPKLFQVEVQPQRPGAIGEGFTAVASAGRGLFEKVVAQANQQLTTPPPGPGSLLQAPPPPMMARRHSTMI